MGQHVASWNQHHGSGLNVGYKKPLSSLIKITQGQGSFGKDAFPRSLEHV